MISYNILQDITSSLIQSKTTLKKFAGKLPSDFFGDYIDLYYIYSISSNFYLQNNTIPSTNYILKEFKSNIETKKFDTFSTIQDIQTILTELNSLSPDDDYIIKIVYKELEFIRLLNLLDYVGSKIESNLPVSVEDVKEKCNSILLELQDLEFNFVKSEANFTLEELHELFNDYNSLDSYIPTGFKLLDKDIHGLSREGEIGIIVAPPNRGKTAILGAITKNMVMRGYKVLFISGETHIEILRKRFWASMCNYDINNLHTISKRRLQFALTGLKRNGGQLYFEDFIGSTFTPLDLENLITKYKNRYGKIDCIVLDYLDLMLPKKSSKELRLAIANIYKEVRGIAVSHGIPIWSASQTNKIGADTPLITEMTIGEDFQKAANADKVISFNQTPAEFEDKVARFFVIKTRGTRGKNKVYELFTEFEKMRFTEIREIPYEEHQQILENLRKKKKD